MRALDQQVRSALDAWRSQNSRMHTCMDPTGGCTCMPVPVPSLSQAPENSEGWIFMVRDEESAGLLVASNLPPLPQPSPKRLHQTLCGAVVVLSAICSTCAITTILSWTSAPAELIIVLQRLAATETCVALICLMGVNFGGSDSTIRRELASHAIPAEVVAALQEGLPLPAKNIEDAELGTFCIRCCVWRPASEPGGHCCGLQAKGGDSLHAYDFGRIIDHALAHAFRHGGVGTSHHCSICQRCVRDFSHHCGVLGRCIAGKGANGNYKYFRLLVTSGYMAACTVASSFLLLSIYAVRGPPFLSGTHAALVAVGCYVAYWLWAGGAMLLFMLWRFAAARRCPGTICDPSVEPPPLPTTPTVVAYVGCCQICSIPVRC